MRTTGNVGAQTMSCEVLRARTYTPNMTYDLRSRYVDIIGSYEIIGGRTLHVEVIVPDILVA